MIDQNNQEVDTIAKVAISGSANQREGTTTRSDRKRRLSKRERKNLKKKKCAVPVDGSITSTHPVSDNKLFASRSNEIPSDNVLLPNSQRSSNQQSSPTLEEYMVSYIPAIVPSKRTNDETSSSSTKKTTDDDSHSKSLGKWFPSASVIKSSVCYSNDYLAKLEKEKKRRLANENTIPVSSSKQQHQTDIPEPKASLVLFYQYVSPTWSQAKVTSFLNYLTHIAKNHRPNIGGRIRVSSEGVNATVSAASTTTTTTTTTNCSNLNPAFEAAQTLRHFAQDLRQFDPVAFAETDFKYVDGLSADRHFKELKLLPVKELVFYGIKEDDCCTTASPSTAPCSTATVGKEVKGGVHLDATEYHEMLKRNDAVVIDVRNHYEAAIGRFDGQMKNDFQKKKLNDAATSQDDSIERSGAEYIDPKMRKSTDFTSWLAEPETKQKLEGKTVLMFCTGE